MIKKVSNDDVQKIIDLYKTESIDKIASKLSISRHIINRILKESGVELRSTGARKGYRKGEKI